MFTAIMVVARMFNVVERFMGVSFIGASALNFKNKSFNSNPLSSFVFI
jgi:hypothetical protein